MHGYWFRILGVVGWIAMAAGATGCGVADRDRQYLGYIAVMGNNDQGSQG